MPIALSQETADTYRLDINGLLLRSEVAQCEADLERELARVGSVRLLCILHAFRGWESKAAWNDLTFYVRHGDAIERIAIVGDEKWRDLVLMFASADLRKAPVEFFPERSLQQARDWLSS